LLQGLEICVEGENVWMPGMTEIGRISLRDLTFLDLRVLIFRSSAYFRSPDIVARVARQIFFAL
jgi:hypothetical protein